MTTPPATSTTNSPSTATTITTMKPPIRNLFHLPDPLHFGPFPIPPTQMIHLSPTRLTYALVNLRPLLPGHTLVIPTRVVPRLHQLSDAETADLFTTARKVGRMLERVYGAKALNVAVQDGVEAGQSVPHVHVHIIPRGRGEKGGDEIYERLEGEEGNLGRVWEGYIGLQRRREKLEKALKEGSGEVKGEPDEDQARVERSEEEMSTEAEMLRGEMERQEEIEKEERQSVGRESG